ncbi:MAG: hypothetical protein AB8B55_14725 [Mariniblastus sp.]
MEDLPNTESIIANCLNCHGLVRVPMKSPANSTVRCPRCNISYTLAQILNESIPELEVMLEPELVPSIDKGAERKSSESLEDDDSKFVVPIQLAKGAQRKSRRHRSSESNGSSSRSSSRRRGASSHRRSRRESRTEEPTAVAKSFSSSSIQAGRSSSRKSNSTNGALEVAKVVVGGLLAIPIAYLLIMWLFNKDPLSIAPSISNTVPFAVPNSLRPDDDEVVADEEETAPATMNGFTKRNSNLTNLLDDIDNADVSDEIYVPNVDPDKFGN